jgi:flagellar protein FlaG
MSVEAVNLAGGLVKSPPKASEEIEVMRREKEDVPEAKQKDVQPEELLSQIKELTEDGVYSVRFENDRDSKQLVVKVVDRQTDEVIRQIPAEELLGLTKRLDDLRGNIIHTQG